MSHLRSGWSIRDVLSEMWRLPKDKACAGSGYRNGLEEVAVATNPMDGALFDGDAADHPRPIMIGTAKIVGARLGCGQEDILGVARLHDDFGALTIKHVGIVDVSARKKSGAVSSWVSLP